MKPVIRGGMAVLVLGLVTEVFAFQQNGLDKLIPKPVQNTSFNSKKVNMASFTSSGGVDMVIEPSGIVVGGTSWTGPNYSYGSEVVSTGDINGDGKADLMQRYFNLPILDTDDLNDYDQVRFEIFFDDLSAPSQTIKNVFNIFPVGDLDNDGFDDAIMQKYENSDDYILFFGSTDGYMESMNGFNYSPITFSTWKTGDVTADGVDDVILFFLDGNNESTLHVLVGNSDRNAISLQAITGVPGSTSIRVFHHNGDNKDYIVLKDASTETETFHIGNVTEGFNWNLVKTATSNYSNEMLSMFDMADVTGDGEADIIVMVQINSLMYVIKSTLDENYFEGFETNITTDVTMNNVRVVGDIDNDGFDDLVFNNVDSGSNKAYLAFGSVLGDGISSNDVIDLYAYAGDVTDLPIAMNNNNPTIPYGSFGDFNGSSFHDFVYVYQNSQEQAYNSWAISYQADIETITANNLNSPVPQNSHEIIYNANAGDWDGDGVDDFAYLYNTFGPGSHVYIKKSTGGEIQFTFTDVNYFYVPTFADIDLDGAVDMILHIRRWSNDVIIQTIDIYSSASATQTTPVETILVSEAFPNYPNMILSTFHPIGDVSGDGIVDLLVTSGGQNEGASYVLFHTDNGYQFAKVPARANKGVPLGDLDDDGIGDFAVNDFNSSSIQIYYGSENLSSSYVFETTYTITPDNAFAYYPGDYNNFAFRIESGDYNGDGYLDIAATVFQSFDYFGSTNGSNYVWFFEGYNGGIDAYPSEIFRMETSVFSSNADNEDEFMTLVGDIQTLPDLNGDQSNELLISTYSSGYMTNAMILMGGMDIEFEEFGYNFGDYRILLDAPNKNIGLGLPSNFINASYSAAVGDFNNDGIMQVVLPQYLDRNFQTNPQYNYDLDVPQVELPTFIEITEIEDVENDQGNWIRIHVDGLVFDSEFFEYRPDWVIWRKNVMGEWVHVQTVPYIEGSAKYAEVSVPKTMPSNLEMPDMAFAYEFMVSMFYGELKSEPRIGFALDNMAPGEPQGIKAISENDQITLSWNPVIASDLMGYAVFQVVDNVVNYESTIATTSNTEISILKSEFNTPNVTLVVLAIDQNNNRSEVSESVVVPITTANEELSLDLPSEFALKQNFPNPFNPTTSIKFEVPESGHISLFIYDMMGRRVATLVDRTMNAGYHSINFDASKLASGIYLYSMESAKGIRITKRMTLVK
ncbi:T9SS type A sorting domain-containing protein [bacterium]|nr:MAG: T9SS type A sorting domain-containing protein [bacterium]